MHFTALWSLFGFIRENTVKYRRAERFCSLDLGNKNDRFHYRCIDGFSCRGIFKQKGEVDFLTVNFGGRIYAHYGNYR